MKNLALAVLLISCGDDGPATDDETHELVTCDGTWPADIAGRDVCEAPCEVAGGVRPGMLNDGCTPTVAAPFTGACDARQTASWEGRIGCCINDADGAKFYRCD